MIVADRRAQSRTAAWHDSCFEKTFNLLETMVFSALLLKPATESSQLGIERKYYA